jgi:hypothetical protein
MVRRLLATLFLSALAFGVTAWAQDKSKKDRPDVELKGDPSILITDSSVREQILRRSFEIFRQKLAIMASRLENGSDKDKEKAKSLRQALKLASDQGTEAKFDSIVRALGTKGADKNLDVLAQVVRENSELRKDLQKIIALLSRDETASNKELMEKTARLLEQLKELIAKQERVRAQTEIGRKNNKELEKDQNKVTRETKAVADGRKGDQRDKGESKGEAKPDSKAGAEGKAEAKNDVKTKAENKPGESKSNDGKEGKSGENKEGTGKETKPGEAKGTDGKEGKAGEAKEGKGADGKPGTESKPGENKSGDGKERKAGENKEGKPGDGKSGEGKEGKSGDGKEGKPGKGKAGESKSGDGKSGDGKPGKGKEGKADEKSGFGKAGEGKDGKASDGKGGKPGEAKIQPGASKAGSKSGEAKSGSKPGDGKSGEGKPSGGKPGESKSGAGKPGEGKPGESKGQGEGKGEAKPGKPSDGKPGSSGGKPGQSKSGSQGKSGQGKPSGNPPQGGNQDDQNNDNPVKKQIEEANKYQKQAEIDLDKAKRDDAVDKQTKAIKELEAAKKKLEDLLRQMREEEIERLLADLEKRCRYMLALQIEVRDGTVVLDKEIAKEPEQKPTLTHTARVNKLADKEEEILREAATALKLIQTEGSAVAFAEVFEQVSKDMENVATRLKRINVDQVTQTIENDIIETLKDMIAALQKAQKDVKQGKPGKGGGQPPPQSLIDQLAELKMIYAMQRRVNARTEMYGKQYKGEQAPPPDSAATEKEKKHYKMIQDELKDLANRQEKIGKVTKDIATGKNEAK